MILVDSSICIDHLQRPHDHLGDLLDGQSVAVHPFVFGEIVMGSLKSRLEQVTFLGDLPSVPIAAEMEVRSIVENEKLYGIGLSYIDAHLLASAVAAGAEYLRLWTSDRKLHDQAARLGVAYAPKAGRIPGW